MPNRPLSDAKRQAVERLLRAGKLGYREIMQRVGVSMGTVNNVAERIGLGGKTAKKRAEKKKRVHDEVKKGGTFRDIGRRLGMSESTVGDLAKRPADVETTAEVPFPEAVERVWQPFQIATPGHWLVISDIHIPCHDRTTIELAVKQAKKDGAAGVLLNGDVMDAHEISTHDKDPSLPRYVEEVRLTRQLLAWLRAEFPDQRIVYKCGNHDARLQRYIANRAPAIEALEGVGLPSVLKFADHGVEWVDDSTVIRLGKLNVVHGHEYRGGGGVNPARWLYLKARSVALTSHFHRTSEHHAKDISGKHEAAWSIGCACELHPKYLSLNEWNNGFSLVHVEQDGQFWVRNLRVMNGKVA
jgi:transposase/predicted phosphodiesterase